MTFAARPDPPGEAVELTLELARRSHEPIGADKTRNLLALRQRLGLPDIGGSGSATPVLQPVAATARARTLGLAPWQQLVAVGAVTGALGFFLGLGVSARGSTPAVSSAPSSAPTALQQALAPLPVAETLAVAPAHPTPTKIAEASGSASAIVPLHAPAKKERRAVSRSAATERSDPFLDAVRLLARARRTLDRQEPALALSLLDELDERFPSQLLDEERAATRVFALCATGEQAAALTLARRWFNERPGSIYTRRLEQSCASEALR